MFPIRFLFPGLLLVLGTVAAVSQTPADGDLAKGKTIEKVVVAADASQSYSLYLPSAYDPSKKFPIVYCFDPGARGAEAVEKFRAAAEKFGYIVVGSNNSRNGLDSKTLSNILNTLWDETHRRLSIDDKRVLAAGLSGGARVASSVANACGCMFGVIGSGAGFSDGVAINEKLPFLFFATIGYNDFNYPEIVGLSKKLAAARVTYRVEAFDAAHQWLDEPLSFEALGWFEIREMKGGRRDKDDALIDELFQARVRRADGFAAEKKVLEAYSSYTGIVDDFKQWHDVSPFADKARAIASSPEYKQALKAETDQINLQQQVTGEFFALGEKLRDDEARMDARSQLRHKVSELTASSNDPADTPKRRVARRTLNEVFVSSAEAASRFEHDGKLALALDKLDMASEVFPKNAGVVYSRARIFAMQGDKKKAIDALNKAIELGLKDTARIKSEKAFETLKADDRFIKLLAGLKQT